MAEKGQTIILKCEPVSGHNDLFWYRQTKIQGLELLSYFRSKSLMEDGGAFKDRFKAEMLNSSFSTLKIQPTEPKDSAVYLCASSLATELYKDALPVQKHLYPPLPPGPTSSELFCAPSLAQTKTRNRGMTKTEDNRVLRNLGWKMTLKVVQRFLTYGCGLKAHLSQNCKHTWCRVYIFHLYLNVAVVIREMSCELFWTFILFSLLSCEDIILMLMST